MENVVGLLTLLAVTLGSPAKAKTKPTLINGEVVPAGEYTEVVNISMSRARCTATLVSDRVILTAAHCVGEGARASFKVAGESYTSVCSRSPLYPRRDHDIAACLTDRAVTGVKPSTVDLNPLKKGEIVTLLGYGCTRPRGGGADGKLRKGEATITGFSGMDAVSGNGAALCFGDSGGPMMREKALVGINSKGNIRSVSYNAQLSIPESLSFMKDFAEKNSVEICGVTSNCQKPKNDCLDEQLVVDTLELRLKLSKDKLKQCEEK